MIILNMYKFGHLHDCISQNWGIVYHCCNLGIRSETSDIGERISFSRMFKPNSGKIM